MKTVALGNSDLRSSRLAYGCWKIAGSQDAAFVTPQNEAEGRRAVIAAYEAGITLFDHADIYCDGKGEWIFGQALKQVSGMRERVVIATKCGIRTAGHPEPDSPYRYDFSAAYIVWSCEQSLKRLGVETIDLYQLHRPDYLGDPAEVAAAFSRLQQQGKARFFGVSNFRPSQFTLLQRACPMPLLVNQVEMSLLKLDGFEDGTLDQCLTEKVTPMAYSPLAAGRLVDNTPIDLRQADHVRRQKLRDVLGEVTRRHHVSPAVTALAWLLRHPAGIVPIIGSTKPDRIRDEAQAADVEISRDEWYTLFTAARGERLP
jgi:predicted oxidoreductase